MVANLKGANGILGSTVMSKSMTYSFTVCPLFILMGQNIYRSGLSTDLFNAAEKWLGGVRGGLAMAAVVACGFFGAICGSLAATVATMTLIALPEMRKNSYRDSLATGSVSAGGTLGVLIPPSTNFIIYGIIAEESIGRLFAAGVVPGIINIIFFCVIIAIIVKVHPDWAPQTQKYSMKEKLQALKGCIGVVVIFVVVIGGMFTGIFSATEAAAIGALVSFIMLLIRRQFTWRNIKASLVETVHTTAMALWMVLGAYIFNCFLTITKMPQDFADLVLSAHLNKYLIIAIIIVFYAIMGCIMDAMAITLLTVPIFLPIIEGVGFDSVWFGVIICLVMNLGSITPPVGLSCYITGGVAKDIPLSKIFAGAAPMCLGILATILVVIFLPELALFLPRLAYG